jgi:zinc transporter ZupT
VGGLLGDVFLHLLPETYQHVLDSGEEGGLARVGAATLTGVLAFLVLEKVLELSNPETNPELREKENKKIVGYLNLLANCTDNLLHGLAVSVAS